MQQWANNNHKAKIKNFMGGISNDTKTNKLNITDLIESDHTT